MTLHLPDQAFPALHLVRHGQSTWNVQGLVQGQTDHPGLTDLGREQAASAAELLRGTGAVRLLTSDLQRAVQSAEIIGAATNLTPISTTLLREQSLGVVEGLSTEMAVTEWDRAAARAREAYGEPVPIVATRLPGGESMQDVLGRVSGLLASPWVTDASGDVIIVSHGDAIRIMLAHLLFDDPDDPIWREIGNGEVHSVYRTSTGAINYIRTAVTGTTA